MAVQSEQGRAEPEPMPDLAYVKRHGCQPKRVAKEGPFWLINSVDLPVCMELRQLLIDERHHVLPRVSRTRSFTWNFPVDEQVLESGDCILGKSRG